MQTYVDAYTHEESGISLGDMVCPDGDQYLPRNSRTNKLYRVVCITDDGVLSIDTTPNGWLYEDHYKHNEFILNNHGARNGWSIWVKNVKKAERWD